MRIIKGISFRADLLERLTEIEEVYSISRSALVNRIIAKVLNGRNSAEVMDYLKER